KTQCKDNKLTKKCMAISDFIRLRKLGLNVFSTFIGSFLFDFGTCGTLIFSFILFSILSFLFNSKISNFIKLFFYIYSCDIVMFGVFYYNLSKSTALLSLIVLFMLVVFLYSNVFHYKFKL
ncbi:hypothetical protein, partial [Bacteroides uniformis]|uniref:hypothetical protein n=1 Tax=Bacteroides uniformis TaxID=820 RepID=UPI00195C5E2E